LVDLWERSVRATHHFLSELDIQTLRPLVAALFDGPAPEFWVATYEDDVPLGFLGYARDSVEALFIDPDHRGCGVGSRLMAYAQALSGSALSVEVNEPNEGAIGFYKAQGFTVVSRSPVLCRARIASHAAARW
jgi:putative acetyltransferase